jgi:hypothetical protein
MDTKDKAKEEVHRLLKVVTDENKALRLRIKTLEAKIKEIKEKIT